MIKTFSPSLRENLDPVLDRIDNGFASVILIEGGLGQGKTTLAVQIADYVNARYGMGLVDLVSRDQLSTGGVEFKSKLVAGYKKGYHAIIYDESGDFSGRRYVSKYNRDLYRIFQIYRAFNTLVILVLPSFTDIDAGLFKLDVVRFALRLHDRDKFCGRFSGYSLKKLIWAKHKIRKGKVLPAFALRKTSPNFHGIFKDLCAERSALLHKASTDAKVRISKELLEEPKKRPDIDLDMYTGAWF